MCLNEFLSAFLRQKRIDGLSEKSISNYAYFIGIFLRYLDKNTAPSDLTLERVQAYILSLRSRGLRSATIATYIRNIKIFLRFVNSLEPLSFSIEKIKLPHVPKKSVLITSSKPWANGFYDRKY